MLAKSSNGITPSALTPCAPDHLVSDKTLHPMSSDGVASNTVVTRAPRHPVSNKTVPDASSVITLGSAASAPSSVGVTGIRGRVKYCTYCQKAIHSKMSRHLLSVHKDEADVLKIRLLPKKSKERRAALRLLFHSGNFKFNVAVLRESGQQPIITGRQNQKHSSNKYVPCDDCTIFVLESRLWLHKRRCPAAVLDGSCGAQTAKDKKYGSTVASAKALLNSAVFEESESNLSQLFSRMKSDDLRDVAMHDRLIRKYASLRVESSGKSEDQKLNDMHRVRQGARTLARLVIEC
jgi:hypothetical protein